MSKRVTDFLAIVLSLLFLLTSLFTGAMLGGVFLRFFMTQATNGWDGIAQGLGALMVGGALGILAAAISLVPLLHRGRQAVIRALLAVIIIGLLAFGALILTRPNRTPSPDPVNQPTVPTSDAVPTQTPPN